MVTISINDSYLCDTLASDLRTEGARVDVFDTPMSMLRALDNAAQAYDYAVLVADRPGIAGSAMAVQMALTVSPATHVFVLHRNPAHARDDEYPAGRVTVISLVQPADEISERIMERVEQDRSGEADPDFSTPTPAFRMMGGRQRRPAACLTAVAQRHQQPTSVCP